MIRNFIRQDLKLIHANTPAYKRVIGVRLLINRVIKTGSCCTDPILSNEISKPGALKHTDTLCLGTKVEVTNQHKWLSDGPYVRKDVLRLRKSMIRVTLTKAVP